MDSSSTLQRGIEAVQAGRQKEARALLAALVKAEPDNEQAWLWLAAALEQSDRRRYCLERAQQVNPANPITRAALAALSQPEPAPPPSSAPVPLRTLEPAASPPPDAPPAAPSEPPAAAPEPAVSPARGTAGSRKVVSCLIGGCLVSLLGLVFLLAVPVLIPNVLRIPSAFRQVQRTLFAAALLDYLAEYPDQKVPRGYINGKAAAIDVDEQTLHAVHDLLPDEVRAEDPAEVQTLIRVSCTLEQIGYYEGTTVGAYLHSCDVQVIDLAIPAVVARTTLTGERPPEMITDDAAKKSFLESGRMVEDGDIAEWLNTLPAVDLAQADPNSFCTPPVLDRFRQMKLGSQALTGPAEAFALERAAARSCTGVPAGGVCGEQVVGPPEWLIRPGPLGCELQIKLAVAGQEESQTMYVVALPSQKVYPADDELAGRLRHLTEFSLLPFWRPKGLPAPLP